MDSIPLTIASDLSAMVSVGLVRAKPVSVGPSRAPLLEEMEALGASLAAEHSGKAPGEIAELQPARALYRAFGIDPTRTRPSSEALLRRVLRGKPLPRVCNAVDLCNLCALRFLLPIGLYDAERIRGCVTLRRGEPGESYPGIRKEAVHLEGRPVLADEEGSFGNPTSDSLRTSVTDSTRTLWMVIFAPSEFPRRRLETYVEGSCGSMALHLAPEGTLVKTAGALLSGRAGDQGGHP